MDSLLLEKVIITHGIDRLAATVADEDDQTITVTMRSPGSIRSVRIPRAAFRTYWSLHSDSITLILRPGELWHHTRRELFK